MNNLNNAINLYRFDSQMKKASVKKFKKMQRRIKLGKKKDLVG